MIRHICSLILLITLGCNPKLQPKVDSSNIENKTQQDPYNIDYVVEPAPEWTNLFYRKSGWFGADGVFSIPLSGVDKQGNMGNDKTMLIFSDTYIGDVVDNKPQPGHKMVNNTIAYVNGLEPNPDSISFHYKVDAAGVPQTFFVPNNAKAADGQYYWLGDGFVNQSLNNTTYIFAYHVVMTGEGVFDFEELDVSLIALPAGSVPPFENQRQLVTPLRIDNDLGQGNLGSGILVNTEWAGAPHPDGYVYVYGCIGKDKSLVSARVKPEVFENFDEWRYWNGSEWDTDIKNIKEIANAVSNELSVTPLEDGRYVAIFQVLGISDKVGMMVGLSPIGPFGEIQEIYTTPEFSEGLFPYNAKAHFNLSKPNELLISYNTITPDFWNDIKKDAHIYRPRFIRLIFK